MLSAARVVLLATSLAALSDASAAHAGQTQVVPILATERVEFAGALRAFRGGDEAARGPLQASADRMARLGREDALGVVAFFASLSSADRRAGLDAESQFDELFVEAASADSKDHTAWSSTRARIQSDLEGLVARQRGAPDPSPAARALSLAAYLDEQRARTDADLPPVERAALLARVELRAREALQLFARVGLLTPTLEPVWLLARANDARGDVEDARAGFENCLDLAERVDSESYRVRALRGLVAAAESEGDLAEQREWLRELAAIREPKDDWWLTRRWAALLVAEDEPTEAERFLTANPPKRPEETGTWHFLLGSALRRLGRAEEAERHFALVRLEPLKDAKPTCPEIEAAIFRGQSTLARGDARGALAILEPLDDATCPSAARAQRAWTIGAAHLELGDALSAETALRGALEHGRALEARLARTDDGSVFGEVVGLETVALLADALTRQGRALEAVRVAEEFQARTLRGRGDARIDEGNVRAWAASFERGLVTWIVGADTTVVAHVAPDGSAISAVIPLGRERLHDAVRRVREAAIAGNESRARKLAQEIEARVLPGEVIQRVRGTGRVLLLAHGPLERMPFDLTSLGEKSPTLVLPGLPSDVPDATPSEDAFTTWSIFGDPSAVDGKSVLPGARTEAERIARLVGSDALTGDRFDRLALVDALRSSRCLHVATHLVHVSGDSSRDSGLLLARGSILSAREIREIAPRLPLAVLAACETAEGRFVDAQALSSVSNAFLASGTRNVCVTLWPVEDGAARDWSAAFHAELLRGVKPSQAAAAARNSLRQNGTPVSEWAAFRFTGRD